MGIAELTAIGALALTTGAALWKLASAVERLSASVEHREETLTDYDLRIKRNDRRLESAVGSVIELRHDFDIHQVKEAHDAHGSQSS